MLISSKYKGQLQESKLQYCTAGIEFGGQRAARFRYGRVYSALVIRPGDRPSSYLSVKEGIYSSAAPYTRHEYDPF
jgi:hypothetical protein